MALLDKLAGGKIISGGRLPTGFSPMITPMPRVVGEAVTSYTEDRDRRYRHVQGPRTVTDYLLRAKDVAIHTWPAPVAIESLHPAIAQSYQGGYVRHVAPGSATIRLTTQGRNPQDFPLAFAESDPLVTSFDGFVSQSLAYAITQAIDVRLSGKTKAIHAPIYSLQDHAAGIYTRNPLCWANAFPITCLSPWNSLDGPRRAGTVISPSFVIYAAHYPLSAGVSIRFITADNQVITRTITAVVNHPDYPPGPDLGVAKLDAPLPPSITHARFLPANWATRLPTGILAIPHLVIDQEEKALIADGGASIPGNGWSCSVPTFPNRLEFFENLIVGDSGNPALWPIGNQLVVLTLWTTGGAGAGTNLAAQTAYIQATMDAMGNNGESLSFADLSTFPSY